MREELPEPFVCAICQQEKRADPWNWRLRHNPPICNYCSIRGGHQVRIPGMTRGDHREMQRLRAITDALLGAANMREYYGRIGSI